MDLENKTLATEFVFLAFSNNLTVNILLFVLLLCVYFITIVGNCLIIHMFVTNTQLQIPMYFLLSNLSFIDLCNSSCALPRLLVDLCSTYRRISLGACLTQVNMLLLIGATECLLLVLMAYDRFIAICLPLHYPILMRWRVCYVLMILVWIFSFVFTILPSIVMPVALCYPNRINHFMCEALAVLHLSCDKNYAKEILIFSLSFITILFPFILILASYIFILISVLKIHSVEKSKTFSTCSSHIAVVVLFFGTGMITYLGSLSQHLKNKGKYISVFYVIIPPMLNPIIYSLNNRDVKIILSTFLKQKCDRIKNWVH